MFRHTNGSLVLQNTPWDVPAAYRAPRLDVYKFVASPCQSQPAPETPQQHDWRVKLRQDGSRYLAKRRTRGEVLRTRALRIAEERQTVSTEDDTASEMKVSLLVYLW